MINKNCVGHLNKYIITNLRFMASKDKKIELSNGYYNIIIINIKLNY